MAITVKFFIEPEAYIRWNLASGILLRNLASGILIDSKLLSNQTANMCNWEWTL